MLTYLLLCKWNGPYQEADWSMEIFINVHKVQLNLYSSNKYIFYNQVTFLDLRVCFSFPVKYNPALQIENKHVSLKKEIRIENWLCDLG